MSKYTLEICVDSVEAACIAAANGATRLEVCSNLVIGGTTPTYGLMKAIKERVSIPCHALIRSRFGDFLYSNEEVEVMAHDIKTLDMADGYVIGVLNKEGSLNQEAMKVLAEATGGKRITLHRCIDMCKEPLAELSKVQELGISTVLTSGSYASATEGLEMLEKFQLEYPSLEILVGAGVNSNFLTSLNENSCLRHFHMSGKIIRNSEMVYRNSRIFMGMPGLSEYEIYTASGSEIKKCASYLQERFGK